MNEIVKSQNVIQSMDDVERAARAMAASKFFPDSQQAAQAIVKVLAGRELGFGAFASMTGVAVIQGKPVVGANLTAAAIKQTGKYNYRIVAHTEQVCEIEFFEMGQSVGKSSFSMDDAKAAGLTNKDNWRKYPRNMLFARAISNGQKWFAPDVYNGVTVYTPDEMGASVDGEGNILDAVVTVDVVNQEVHYDEKPAQKPAPVAPKPAPAKQSTAPAQLMTLDAAHKVKDAKGELYADKTVEQLTVIKNTPAAPQDKQQAAELLIKEKEGK